MPATPTDHHCQPQQSQSEASRAGWRKAIPRVIAAIVILCIAVSLFLPHSLTSHITSVTQALRNLGPLGWLIFITAEAVVALVGILPASLLGMAAGAVYGVTLGFITSALGIFIGAIIAFALSRSLARPLIVNLAGRRAKLASLDQRLAQDSWRLVALLRVSPVMPFSLTSYVLGLSGITLRAYIIGTMASLPALLGYVAIGKLGGTSLSSESHIRTALLILGAGATLALTIHLSRLLSRALATA
ncbi:MAG: TVP38/TMEM64 family protein [Acidocella sp.]|nr:TVP38/TMEM64 family protein [Acidocella sp.]